MHVEISALPATVRDALKSAGYGRADIRVTATEAVNGNASASGDGYRGFVIILNLDTGASRRVNGSWGGANMFTQSPVDSSEELIPIPTNGAVIKGQHGPRVYADLYVNPAMFRYLDSGDDVQLSDAALQALCCFVSVKGGAYRRDEMRRRNVSTADVDALVESGHLKRNKAGATQVTTKGRNASTVTR